MEATTEPFFQIATETCYGFKTIVDNYPQPTQGLYGIYCLVNGKWYIGVSKNVLKRSKKHAETDDTELKFKNALRKHGVHNFVFIPLCYAPKATRKWLHEKETALILLFDSIKNGYNVILMAQGPVYGPEHGRRVSEGLAKPDARAKVLAANRKINQDPNVRAKISDSVRDTYEDPEVHEKISKKVRASWDDPVKRAARLEKLQSPEARARAAETFSRPDVTAKRNAALRTPERKVEVAKWFGTPEAREKNLSAIRDPEVQRKKAINQRAYYDNPGVREAHGARMREVNAADPTINERRAESVRKSWEARRAKQADARPG